MITYQLKFFNCEPNYVPPEPHTLMTDVPLQINEQLRFDNDALSPWIIFGLSRIITPATYGFKRQHDTEFRASLQPYLLYCRVE